MLGNETFTLAITIIAELLIYACGQGDFAAPPNEELTNLSVQNDLTQNNLLGA